MSEKTKKYIAEHELFSGLNDEYITTLADCAIERDFVAGENLFSQGQKASTFYLTLSGNIVVETPAIAGPTMKLQSLGSGRILGWSWLIPPYRWHFQARVEQDARVLEFDGEKLLRRCEKDPGFGYELLKRFASLMGDRLESARKRMIDTWNPSGFA